MGLWDGLDLDGMPGPFVAAVGSVILTTGRGGIHGGADGRQCGRDRILQQPPGQQPQPGARHDPDRELVSAECGAGVAGMSGHGDRRRSRRGESPLEFIGEQQIGEFGLEIGVVETISVGEVEVVEIHHAAFVADAADRHHP